MSDPNMFFAFSSFLTWKFIQNHEFDEKENREKNSSDEQAGNDKIFTYVPCKMIYLYISCKIWILYIYIYALQKLNYLNIELCTDKNASLWRTF